MKSGKKSGRIAERKKKVSSSSSDIRRNRARKETFQSPELPSHILDIGDDRECDFMLHLGDGFFLSRNGSVFENKEYLFLIQTLLQENPEQVKNYVRFL